jgi:hypothetical protein
VFFYFIDFDKPIFTKLGINVMPLEPAKVCTVRNNSVAEFGASDARFVSSGQGNPSSTALLVCR